MRKYYNGGIMRLYAKILDNVSNVNHWNYANQAYIYEGQVNEMYIQLVDLSKNLHVAGSVSANSNIEMRYIPQGVTSVSIEFPSIDDSEVFSIAATQPFIDDKSIWKVTIPSNKMPQSGAFKLTLIESGASKSVMVKDCVRTVLLKIGSC